MRRAMRSPRACAPAVILCAAAACSAGRGGGGDGAGDGGVFAPDAAIEACAPASAGAFTFAEIATWRDGATAAYSMFHDDMCGPAVYGIQDVAVPLLAQHGIVAGLAPIVEQCELNGLWDVVAAAEAAGHEIVSHSYSHPEISTVNAAHEVAEAKAVFDQHVVNPITFFVFPYDYFTPETIAAVSAAGHLGARAGNRDDNDGFEQPPINPATPTNDLALEFDVWPRSYSKYALFFPADMLAVHVHNAIERGGWALREFHSVIADGSDPATQGFGPITASEYAAHLQFLAAAWKKGVLWTGTPSTVLRYRHARTACGASVVGETITFDTSNPDCVMYATPITVVVTTQEDLPRVDATQGGEAVWTRKLGPNRFGVTADPTRGDVALVGCSNPGHEVDPSVALPPKPQPAASVCLIESVAGQGGAGRMDDLERDPAMLQVLPNPSQQDGRTGSWSWYPQAAEVDITPEGDGRVLRYRGTALAAWSGVTLAFLGGNGAGTCYDAGAYTGIRFRIKGSVSSSDTLNGKMVVSVVTAKTQSRLYGGDLMGEGGHFHKVIDVTPGWTTVSIPFAELTRPSWGATTGLSAVAKDALQAIDWGVSNMATSFDVSIDDIELY